MIKDLLKNARSYLEHFFDLVDLQSVENVFDLCKLCQGTIIITGVGKSGIIAEKIAMTLISTGTRALYLPAMNFLHGDIGIVSEKDILLMISKTGESEELLNLIPFIKKRRAKIIALVSNPQSRLGKQADIALHLPVEKELCSFNLVPTISTAVQLILGDVLAVALMKDKQFALEEYALNHPAGAIGKKLTLTIEDLMLKGEEMPVCSPLDSLGNVLPELSAKKCGALLVCDPNRKMLGIFTDGDLRRALQSKGTSVLEDRMQDLMNPSVDYLSSNALAWDALKHMQRDPAKWIAVLPVINQDRLVGILRMHDLVQAGLT